MTRAYYNEIEPYATQWLKNLIAEGLIADGDVDERSIWDVSPSDLDGYTQCHFFAGIGGWSRALRLAGWPDDKPVWTGSCPCQPFSQAGKGLGFDDERHLWPAWHWLISQQEPDVIFGEQVDAAIGRSWLDLVSTDLENAGYRVGPIVLPAASIGAPHIRHRLWFVADSTHERQHGKHTLLREELKGKDDIAEASGCSKVDVLANSKRIRNDGEIRNNKWEKVSEVLGRGANDIRSAITTNGFWGDADWLHCRDGKWRSVEPGTQPLANGVSDRVGKLRAYGNAIVPQVAAEVIATYVEVKYSTIPNEN